MDVLKRPAEEFENDNVVEELWAYRAIEHAEIYFNLICSVDPQFLKLTPFDNEIYTQFRHDFPDLRVDILNESEIKSIEGKQKWRIFIEKFNKLDDYSFGSLVRINSSLDFSQDNSMFVVRIQFLAIEIARNREGHNDIIRHKYGAFKPPSDTVNS